MTESQYVCNACKKPISFGVAHCPVCGKPQRPGTGQLWLGERRLVTILFADLASFTAASENADPEDLIDMLNHVFSRLMVHCDREGGYLDKTVGDQLMVLFGAPRAHEDDPARAVRAAVKMQETMKELIPLMREKVGTACKINIGIHTGPVVWGRMGPPGRGAATVIGDAVNLASRLQSFATGGQIVVSELVYHQTKRLFDYEVLDPIRVKGKSDLIPVYMPLHPRQQTQVSVTSSIDKTPLMERAPELQALHTHWSRGITGYAQLIILKGAAGLGKSRLLAEFLSGLDDYAADKRPLVLQTNSEFGPDGNYSPLTDLLHQLFGITPGDTDLVIRRKIEDRGQILGIAGGKFLPLMGYLLGRYHDSNRLVDAEQAADHLEESAIDAAAALIFKQSSQRPTLIIIDDLQWADASTLQSLRRLAIMKQMLQSQHEAYSLMVLVAARPQQETLLEPLDADTIIDLPPLSESARQGLISHLLPGHGLPTTLVERICRESDGNPFYIEEAVRGLVQSGQLVRKDDSWELNCTIDQIDVPPGVEGLVMAHLDALDPISQVVLQHASVIGLHFSLELLSAITPVNNMDSALTDLKQRGLINRVAEDGEDQTFTFTQTIVREVVYRSILRKTRRELHQRIAQLTETKTSSDTDDIVSLAYHYAAGGNQEKTIVYNWLTGQHAFDQFDFDKAYYHLELAWTALEEMSNPNPNIYRNVVESLGDASTLSGKFDKAKIYYEIVKGLIGDDSDTMAMHYYKLGRLSLYETKLEEASQSFWQALNLAKTNPGLAAQIEAEIRLMQDMG